MARAEVLAKIEEWIEALKPCIEAIEDKAISSRIMGVVTDMAAYYKKIEPKPPRKLSDAYTWAMRRAGTYVALLDAENNLLRTVRVSEQVVKEFTYSTEEKEISVTMKSTVLIVPELGFEKPVPKKTAAAQAFAVPEKGKEPILLE